MARRTRLVLILLVLPWLAAGLAVGTPRGAAASTVCGDTQSGIEFINGGTIRDSVVVPNNAECVISSGASVRGGVTAGSGSALTISGSEIRGSVTANDSAYIDIFESVVRGGIAATRTFGAQVVVFRTQVRADELVTDSTVLSFSVTNNTAGGSMILRGNPADSPIAVASNTIDVNLDCTNNAPDPALGVSATNSVGSAATGVCVGLVAS